MCGICGVLYSDRERSVSPSDLKSMTDSIRHRGPDDEGFHIDGNCGLGFRRLSIIDLSSGHQPISNEDGTIWIIFNGEIYNFRELRVNLQARGHRFRTKTDTEVILHLYEDLGTRCVEFLRGMFAFALWDATRRRLFCARDRFGIKPFFYYIDGQQFAFASEMKAIFRLPDIHRQLDLEGVDSFFTYGYITGEKTIYTNFKKLPAAHTLVIEPSRPGTPVVSRYWDMEFVPNYQKTEEEWIHEVDAALSAAVRSHLESDVPLGAFLSGGIDSSSVVALMARHCSQPVKTFSIGFRDFKQDERPFAKEVALRCQTDHHEEVVEPDSVDLLPRLVRAYDLPLADSSIVPTYFLSRFARQYVTVALSGDGGDELFCGYYHYAKLRDIHRYNVLPDGLKKGMFGTMHAFIPQEVRGKGITYLLAQGANTLPAHLTVWTRPERKRLYTGDLRAGLNGTFAECIKEGFLRGSHSDEYLSRLQELDLRTYLTDDILMKVDIASMQHSLEVRVPLLDHRFAELTFTIPADFKLRKSISKYVLKRTMHDCLPASVLNHRKQGFGMPFQRWFKRDLKDYIADTLLHPGGALDDYLEPSMVRSIVGKHNQGMRDFSGKIWSLLVFSEWLRQNSSSKG